MPDQELDILPSCDSGRFPCWRIEEDAAHCGYTRAVPHMKLVIDRNGAVGAPDLRIKASCVTTEPPGPGTP